MYENQSVLTTALKCASVAGYCWAILLLMFFFRVTKKIVACLEDFCRFIASSKILSKSKSYFDAWSSRILRTSSTIGSLNIWLFSFNNIPEFHELHYLSRQRRRKIQIEEEV